MSERHYRIKRKDIDIESKVWYPIIMAEITAEEVAKRITKPITVEVLPEVKIKPFVTGVYDRKDVTIKGDYRFLKLEGSGEVEEVLIEAPSSNYSLRVEVDDKIVYSGSYDDFAEYSEIIATISAFEKNGSYLIHLTDIHFSKSVTMTASGSLTLSKIYAKYKILKGNG
jgi:hypothetical protein